MNSITITACTDRRLPMQRYDPIETNNEALIKNCIQDHLKIDDPAKQKAMEKLFIYNLLN
jgi:hypothetical protein